MSHNKKDRRFFIRQPCNQWLPNTEALTNVGKVLRSKVAPTPQESLEDSLSALGVLFTLEGSLPDSEVGLELFKVIQEISRNASAHGGATSLIVTITPSQISVHNDGRELSSSESEGFGLQGIAERLDIVDWQISPSSSFRRFEIVTEP